MSLHYLIDGYNVLYALPEMPPGSLEKKRDALLDRIIRENPHGKNRITVVFDSREGSGDQSRRGEIHVAFTSGETADEWIVEHVRRASNPRTCVVISDDKGLGRLLRGTGAKWLGAGDFWRQAKPPPAGRQTRGPEINSAAITEEMKKKWLG